MLSKLRRVVPKPQVTYFVSDLLRDGAHRPNYQNSIVPPRRHLSTDFKNGYAWKIAVRNTCDDMFPQIYMGDLAQEIPDIAKSGLAVYRLDNRPVDEILKIRGFYVKKNTEFYSNGHNTNGAVCASIIASAAALMTIRYQAKPTLYSFWIAPDCDVNLRVVMGNQRVVAFDKIPLDSSGIVCVARQVLAPGSMGGGEVKLGEPEIVCNKLSKESQKLFDDLFTSGKDISTANKDFHQLLQSPKPEVKMPYNLTEHCCEDTDPIFGYKGEDADLVNKLTKFGESLRDKAHKSGIWI